MADRGCKDQPSEADPEAECANADRGRTTLLGPAGIGVNSSSSAGTNLKNEIETGRDEVKSRSNDIATSADAVSGSECVTNTTETMEAEFQHQNDPLFEEFYATLEQRVDDGSSDEEVQLQKQAEDEIASQVAVNDPKMTSEYHLERLFKPGSTYLNLNPFEVLEIDFSTCVEDIKKKYRKLSILVHPDKLPDKKDIAQKAFEYVNRAYKSLTNDTERRKCLEVVDEARDQVNKRRTEEKRRKAKQAKKNNSTFGFATISEDADDMEQYEKEVRNLTSKLFADLERIRAREEAKNMEERKRRAEEKTEEEDMMAAKREWNKNYEESRDARVGNWQNFQTNNNKKKRKKSGTTGVAYPSMPKP